MARQITINLDDAQEAAIQRYFKIAQKQQSEINALGAAADPPIDPLPALAFDGYAQARIGGVLDTWASEAVRAEVDAMDVPTKFTRAQSAERAKLKAWADAQ